MIQYPRLGYYGATRGDGRPILNSDGLFNHEALEKQARWDHVILDVYPVVHRPDILFSLRSYNPTMYLYMYVVMKWWANPFPALGPRDNDFAWRFYQIVSEQTNGILYRIDGQPFENWVNLSNPETCRALADLIVEHSHEWSGVFLDEFCPAIFAGPEIGIDYIRAGHLTWTGFLEAWKAGHRRLSQQVKDGIGVKPLIGNYSPGAHSDIFSGWMRENFPYQNTNETMPGWEANMIENPYGYMGYLNEAYVEPHMSVLVSDPLGGTAQSAQRLRFGLASATLDDGIHSFKRGEKDEAWVLAHLDWWFPEYDFGGNQLGSGRGWLGQAYGPAVQQGGVWMRDFEKGRVYVNPSPRVQRVTTPLMRQYNSAAKRAWTIQPNDGLFLQRQ